MDLFYHAGLGDAIICNGMTRYYCKLYDSINIMINIKNEKNIKFMFVRNDYLHLLKEDISTITANDIYVNTNIVNNILQHLNQNGEITSDIFYLKK